MSDTTVPLQVAHDLYILENCVDDLSDAYRNPAGQYYINADHARLRAVLAKLTRLVDQTDARILTLTFNGEN